MPLEYKMSVSLLQVPAMCNGVGAVAGSGGGGGGGGNTVTTANGSGLTAGAVASAQQPLSLNLVAGANITLTPSGSDSSVTIASTGGGGGGASISANGASVTCDSGTGSGSIVMSTTSNDGNITLDALNTNSGIITLTTGAENNGTVHLHNDKGGDIYCGGTTTNVGLYVDETQLLYNGVAVAGGGSSGSHLVVLATPTTVTAKVAGAGTEQSASYPYLTWDAGLTAGHSYRLDVYYDGGVNATVSNGSSTVTFTVSPFISNALAGTEGSIPTLFGYSQSTVASAPSSVLANGTGATPVFDFAPIYYSCVYPALDANVYLNLLCDNTYVGGSAYADRIGWASPNAFPSNSVSIVWTDLGVTPV